MIEPPRPDSAAARRWRPRLRLSTLLIITLVMSVVAAATGYLVRAARPNADDPTNSTPSAALAFLLFTLAAPVLVMIVVSLTRRLFGWLAQLRSKTLH